MRKFKCLKKNSHRIISFLLAVLMFLGFVPTTMVRAEENDLTVLQSIHSDIGEIDEAYSYFSIGTVQSSVEERGRYALTIYRDGNTELEASVELKSVDVSAKYGEDYIVSEKSTRKEEELTDKSLLEMVADEENQKKVDEIEETFEQAVQNSIDIEESDEVEATENKTETPSSEDKEKSEESEDIPSSEKNDTEVNGSENKEYSSLAEMKAVQTGLPTRETWDNEGVPLESLFLNNTSIDPGQEIITSSTTSLVFAPGETEKLIVFEIIEDKEAEGQELLNFLLSAPDEMSALSDYISIAISIDDDEPIEYSEISFSEAKYESDDDNVVITVVREKALYSFVTARVHSNEIGEAETGVNFAGVNGLLEFAPYQKEVSFEIPVRPEGDMAFELVLGEVKGGVEGECSTAKVYLSENEANKIEYSENKPTLHLASSKDSAQEIVIGGKTYELEGDSDSSVLKIMDSSKNPKVHVGDYYLPIPVNKASGTGADVENTIGNVEYGFKSGDSGRQNNGYNIPDKYGHLCWYSGWVWDKGAEIAKYQISLPQYQYLALDCETLSKYESSECGMKLNIRNTELNQSQSLTFARKGQQSRQVSTPVLLVGDPNGKKWIPDTWDSKTTIDIYAERTAKYLVEPEIKFWGIAAMLRQFDITLVQPDAMKYLNGDVTVQKAPARAILPAGHDSRYVNQDLSILYSSIEEGGSINGELIGYDVKFGNTSDYYRYETTDTTLSFFGDFLAFIDEHIGDSIEIKKTGGVATSYVSKLTIKPVFKYKDVRVEINPSEYGTFDDSNLKKTTTNVYHVGDTIKLSATSYEKYKDYEFESYESEAYVNPGDTKPEESGVIPADYELTFKKIRYTLKPVFSQQKNIIEVQLDEEAKKYFTVTNIVPKEQLTYTDMKGKNVIYIDDPLDGETHTRPVYGKVYEVSLSPTALNDGTYRPRITQLHTGDTVNGYFMYVRAYERADKNVINVSAERCAPNDYQAFTLEGYARYSSVTLRQSVAGVTNQPATNVIASTATINQKVYDSNKNLIWGIQKYSGKNKIVTEINEKGNEISKVLEGSYEINGIQAISGDTISVKITNNDVEQVQYVTLSASGQLSEKKTVEATVADPETKKNLLVSKEIECTIVKSDPVDMPVRTPYSPYVANISYKYLKNDVDTRVNSIPIIYGKTPDTLTVTADVEFNNHPSDTMKVYFSLVDQSDTEIVREEAKFNATTKQYYWDFDPSELASDGDKIYVQIESKEIEYSSLNTGLSFYTPLQDAVVLKMEMEQGRFAENVPVMSDLSSKLSSGKMKLGMPEYEDPDNKATSAYSMTFSVSVSVADTMKAYKKLDEIKNGKTSEATLSRQDSIKEAAKSVTDNIVKQELSKVDPDFDKKPQDEQDKLIKSEKDKMIQKKTDEVNKTFNKASLAKLNDNFDWDIKVSVLLRVEYIYDPINNQHIFAGMQYAIGVMGEISKTQYWMISGVPVYLNMSGWASFQLDGSGVTDDAILTESKMLEYENVADLPVRSSVPWAEFGLGIKLEPGVGICGMLGIRGIFEASSLFRVNIDPKLIDQNMHGGVRFTIGGGVALDLLLFSIEHQIGEYQLNTGVYNPDNYKTKATTYGLRNNSLGMEEQLYARNYDAVEEEHSFMGKRSMLRSSLEPISKKNLIQGTLEYIRPQMVTLPDGRIFMIYLQNRENQKGADSSQLVYSIRDFYGAWSKPVVIDSDNKTFETSPELLLVGGNVYIAWSYANRPLSSKTDIESVKADMQSLDVKMCVFDSVHNCLGTVKRITDDPYMNSYVRMVAEDDDIALYYLKQDLQNAKTLEELSSMTSNYNTWAKVLYSPLSDEIIEQPVASGSNVTEKLMNIKHPDIHDPLVLDYSVASFKYNSATASNDTYTFSAYSIDKDKNILSNGDREVWLEMHTEDKSYSPIKIATDSGYVSNLQMTTLNEDAFLTWISETSVFNSVSLRELLENLDKEVLDEQMYSGYSGLKSSLEYILDSDGIGFDWAKTVVDELDAELSQLNGEGVYSKLRDFAEGKLSINTVDFATPNTEIRKEVDIRNYRIVQGEDGNIYLFWTGSNYDPEQLGTELFGTSYYRLNDGWQDKWESNMPETGWGKPVQLTKYGEELEENLVLDELEVTVQKDKGAIVIANSYEIDIDDNGMVQYDQHNLTEIVCQPISSLKIIDNSIKLSEEYPIPGEKITVSFNVKNEGLLPSEGNIVSLSVIKDGKVLVTKRVEETDAESIIYVGNEFCYSTSMTLPKSLEYPFELKAEVVELVKTPEEEYVALGKTAEATRTIQYAHDISFGNIEDFNRQELESFIAERQSGDAYYDAYQVALENMAEQDEYTHAYFIPVENLGNYISDEMEFKIVYVDEYFKTGDTLGYTEKFTVDAREEKVVCALVNVQPEHFRKVGDVTLGTVETMVAGLVDGKESRAYSTHHTIYEIEDIGFTVNDGKSTLSLSKNEKQELKIKGYPFNFNEKNLHIDSSDESVIAVNHLGELTALSSGSATVEVTDNNTGHKESLLVTVNNSDKPDDSDKPSDSDKPDDSDKPSDSDKQSDSDKSSDSNKPSDSDKPNNSNKPSESDEQSDSDKSDDSNKLDDSDKSDDSNKLDDKLDDSDKSNDSNVSDATDKDNGRNVSIAIIITVLSVIFVSVFLWFILGRKKIFRR